MASVCGPGGQTVCVSVFLSAALNFETSSNYWCPWLPKLNRLSLCSQVLKCLCLSACSQRDSRPPNPTDAVTVTTTDLVDLHHLVTDAAAHPDGLCFSHLSMHQWIKEIIPLFVVHNIWMEMSVFSGGADLQRDEGMLDLGWKPSNEVIITNIMCSCSSVSFFCCMCSALRPGETAIAARAPAAIAAGPETDATAPNHQVKKQNEAGCRFWFDIDWKFVLTRGGSEITNRWSVSMVACWVWVLTGKSQSETYFQWVMENCTTRRWQHNSLCCTMKQVCLTETVSGSGFSRFCLTDGMFFIFLFLQWLHRSLMSGQAWEIMKFSNKCLTVVVKNFLCLFWTRSPQKPQTSQPLKVSREVRAAARIVCKNCQIFWFLSHNYNQIPTNHVHHVHLHLRLRVIFVFQIILLLQDLSFNINPVSFFPQKSWSHLNRYCEILCISCTFNIFCFFRLKSEVRPVYQ